jgi:hypothetical protein
MKTIIIVLALGLLAAGPAAAQDRPRPVGEFAAGVLLFPDEGIVTEGFVGGAGRFYLSPRISVGPEVAYISGDNHSHVMLTGNMTFDFFGPESGRPRPVTPFLVVGGGLFRSRYIFPENEVFTHNEGSFTAGGGVRAAMGERVVAGIEARLGWETHIRLNGFIGVRF